MADSTKELKLVISAQDLATAILKKVSREFEEVQRSVKRTTSAIPLLKTAFSQVGSMAKYVGTGALIAGTGIIAFATKAAFSAARVEELQFALYAIAKANKISTNEVNNAVEALRKNNIAHTQALQITSKFIQAELALTDATKLSTVAKDLAVIAGLDSSEATDTLTDAIITNRAELLRQFGIVTTVDTVLESYAATVGKAAEDLTEAERKQAFLNTIMQAGEKVAGTYDAAMGSVSKQFRSLTGRILPDFLAEIGKAFSPMLTFAIQTISGAIERMRNAVRKLSGDSGELNTIFEDLKPTLENIKQRVEEIDWEKVAKNIIKTTKSLLQLIDAVDKFITKHPQITKVIAALTLLGIVILKFGPYAGIFLALAMSIIELSNRTSGWARVVKLLLGPIGAASDLLANWKKIIDGVIGGFTRLKEIGIAVFQSLEGIINPSAERIANGMKLINPLLRKSPSLVDNVVNGMAIIKDAFKSLSAEDILKGVRESMEKTKDTALETTDSILKSIGDYVKGFKEAKAEVKQVYRDLKDENIKYKQSLAGIKYDYLENIYDIVTGEQEKLADTKAQLNEEVAKGTEASQEKIATYQNEIATIEAFLQKHAAEVAKIKDFQKKDEIEKLNERYAEQIKSEQEQHKDSVKRLKDNLKEIGRTYWEKFNDIYNNLKENNLVKLIEYVGQFQLDTDDKKTGKKKKSGAKKQMGGYIDQTGLYTLHAGERVIPASQNSGSRFSGTINLNMGGVTINNEADENRLVKKIQDTLSRQLVLSEKGLI